MSFSDNKLQVFERVKNVLLNTEIKYYHKTIMKIQQLVFVNYTFYENYNDFLLTCNMMQVQKSY